MTVANSSTENIHDRSWPPGFRFHPTDEELVLYYLKRKICRRRLRPDIIGEIDVYKWDPEELPGQSILKTRDRQWFFFSPRDRKYPNGMRSNRATIYGYWKATGKDRAIFCNSRTVGNKKTLVFYRGRAPGGERTDWVMHEYTIDDEELKRCQTTQDYYALYKLYKKSGPGPKNGEQYGAPFNEDDWADDPVSAEPLMNDTASAGNLEDVIHLPLNEIDAVENFISYDPPHVLFQSDALNASITQGCSPNTNPYPLHGEPQCMEQALSQHVVPEITGSHLEQHIADQDFLEMNDLQPMGSVISSTQEAHSDKAAEDQAGFDLFYDTEMFLRELGPLNHEFNTDSFLNDFEDHSASDLFQHHPPVGGAEQHGAENGTQTEDESWFSSALWAFVESIPTSPASAAEVVVKNKALEKISSFSRLKAAATEGSLPLPLVERRGRSGKRSLFHLCLLVILSAIVGLMMFSSGEAW